MVEELVKTPVNPARRDETAINVLPGSHLTPGDIEELRTIIEDFGLEPTFLPDLGGSLDGHIPDDFTPTTIGGVGVNEVATMGNAGWTIAIGAQMRDAAEAMQKKTGAPYRLFERLCGLAANDELMAFLTEISGRPAPMKYRRQRGQLVDAMLDGHFHIGGRKLAIGAEPDLLYDVGSFLHEMGAHVLVAVTTTQSPALENMPIEEVLIGDLEDLENLAKARGCDLLVTHSHGRQAADRLENSLLSPGHSDVRPPRRRASIVDRLSRHARPDLHHRQSHHRRSRSQPSADARKMARSVGILGGDLGGDETGAAIATGVAH